MSIISTSPSGKIAVQSHADGFLYCGLCHGKKWCEEIKEVIQTDRDAKSLWDEFKNSGWQHISVPLRPSDQIDARVLLGRPHQDTGIDYALGVYLEANIDRIDEVQTRVYGSPDARAWSLGWFLGYLSPGEGRRSIRDMIIDWFDLSLDGDFGRCIGMNHTGGREVALNNVIRANPDIKFSNQWTMATARLCVQCFKEGPRATMFDPDLIPST